MFSATKPVIATFFFLLAPGLASAQDQAPSPSVVKPFTAAETTKYLKLGERAIGYFFDGKADSLVGMMAPETAEGVGGIDGITEQMDMVGERAGVVLEVLDQKMTRREGRPQYWWEANFSEITEEPIVFRFIFDDNGTITGVGMGPKSRSPSDPES